MIKDHYKAFLLIKEASGKKQKLSIDFFKEIGANVMKSTGGFTSTISGRFDTSKGDLRLAQVYVDKKYFPDFSKVPDLLQQFIENANQRIDELKTNDVIKLAADIHYNFVNILIHSAMEMEGQPGY